MFSDVQPPGLKMLRAQLTCCLRNWGWSVTGDQVKARISSECNRPQWIYCGWCRPRIYAQKMGIWPLQICHLKQSNGSVKNPKHWDHFHMNGSMKPTIIKKHKSTKPKGKTHVIQGIASAWMPCFQTKLVDGRCHASPNQKLHVSGRYPRLLGSTMLQQLICNSINSFLWCLVIPPSSDVKRDVLLKRC